VVLRVIPTHIYTIDELQLPKVLEKICQERRGLVLVTWNNRQRKVHELAAIIDHINSNRTEHIITIEDPIEFLHRDKKAFVSQREVEVDTKSSAKLCAAPCVRTRM
jgi:twitching motility protein PilT